MTNREAFMEKMNKLFDECPDLFGQDEVAEQAMEFYNTMKNGKSAGGMTENGQKILSYMQENKDECNNQFKAADIAEGIGVATRSVGGSIRKLITDGYVKKIGEKPVIYALTE